MWPTIKLPSWALPAAIGAALLAVLLLLAFCSGKNTEVAKQQKVEAENQKRVGTANDKAADLRVEDKARIVRENREIEDALKNATSGDDARRRTGCAIMQQQGVEHLPAACTGS